MKSLLMYIYKAIKLKKISYDNMQERNTLFSGVLSQLTARVFKASGVIMFFCLLDLENV